MREFFRDEHLGRLVSEFRQGRDPGDRLMMRVAFSGDREVLEVAGYVDDSLRKDRDQPS
jgi:hypothetical protein